MKTKICLIIFACLLFQSISAISNDSIQSLIQNCKADTQKINIYLKAARQYEFDNLDLSKEYVNKALTLSKKAKYYIGEADSYLFMGLLKEDIADYDNAKKYFNKALDVFKKTDNKKGIGTAYNNLGSMYEYIGEHDTAVVFFQKSIKINDESGNELGSADARYNIALIHYTNGNYDLALTNWFKVIDVYEKLKDYEGLSACQHCIGMTLRRQNKDEKAIEFLEKAKENGLKSGDDRLVGNIIMSIGNVYLENEDLEKAIKYFREAAILYEGSGDLNGIASIETNIGDYHKYNNRVDSAIIYYNSSYEKFHQLNVKQGEMHTLAELAECYKIKGDYEKALDYCNQALELAKQISSKEYQSMVYQLIYMIYNKQENYEKALKYYIKHTEIEDSIFSESKQEIIEELQTRYETEKKEQKIILQQADIEKKQVENEKKAAQRNIFIVGFGLMVFLAFVILRSYRHKKKANILLAKQNEEIQAQRDLAAQQRDLISEQKQELTDSIHYAYRIQSAVIPDPEYISSLLTDYFIFYKPRDIVSGDFYWVGKKNEKLIIIAADCTGHGVPGAFMSMMGVAFLNDIINKEDVTSPADILNKLRDNIIKAMQQSGKEGEQRDGMDVAAIAIDPGSNKMEFAGANNPLYFIQNNELIEMPEPNLVEVKGDKMPISLHRKMESFSNHTLKIKKNDIIYIFSDGYADQFGGENGKKFKYKPFRNLLLNISSKPMSEQKKILDETLEKWKGEFDQIDDVLVMGIKI